jgi:hypothetical protein
MPILNATKQRITDFVHNKGFILINNESSDLKGLWELSCGNNHEHLHLTVSSLQRRANAGSEISCPKCKEEADLRKFLEASDVYLTDHNLLTCNDCELSYRYFGNWRSPFRCYCKLV